MKERFKQFLIKNNSYERFCNELKREREDNRIKYKTHNSFDECIDSFEKGSEDEYLLDSFLWPDKEKGFWEKLSDKWIEELK